MIFDAPHNSIWFFFCYVVPSFSFYTQKSKYMWKQKKIPRDNHVLLSFFTRNIYNTPDSYIFHCLPLFTHSSFHSSCVAEIYAENSPFSCCCSTNLCFAYTKLLSFLFFFFISVLYLSFFALAHTIHCVLYIIYIFFFLLHLLLLLLYYFFNKIFS